MWALRVRVNANIPERGGGTVTPTTEHIVPAPRTASLRDGRFTAGPVLSRNGEDPTTGLLATRYFTTMAVSR